MSNLAKNKKAYFDYEILETLEAGIMLAGHEVKSIRNGGAKLKGSYITFRGEEVFADNIHIRPYAHSTVEHAGGRKKLLLHKKQALKVIQTLQTKGLTVIPLRLYLRNHKIKMEIGIARGRNKADKRHVIRDRQEKRRMESVLKKY